MADLSKGTRIVSGIMRVQIPPGDPSSINSSILMATLPSRLTTPRLLLRNWEPGDQSAFEQAVAQSFDHLRPWLPWARVPVEDQWSSLQEFMQRPGSAQDVLYALFDAGESGLLGGVGVHHRGNDGEREIGYWLHADLTGRGYMSEAVSAVTDLVFATLLIPAVTIICDPANTRSAAVPRRLGYELKGIFPVKIPMPDRTEDMIWSITREAWELRNVGIVV